MRKRIWTGVLALGVVCGLLPSETALGQFESALQSRIKLNLVNPGGKSLALGGAFVSLADDATAALANPAGLPQLSMKEAGISGKGFFFEPNLPQPNYTYISSGQGWRNEGLNEKSVSDSVQDLEYVSLVWPVSTNVVVAGYRAVNLRYQLSTEDFTNQSYRWLNLNSLDPDIYPVSLDEQGKIDIRNEVYGISAGARFERFSVGAGVTLSKLKLDLSGPGPSGHLLFLVNKDNPDVGDFEQEVSASPSSSWKAGGVLGFRWEIEEQYRINLGGVYRYSPKYDVDYRVDYYLYEENAAGQIVKSKVPDGRSFACGQASKAGDAIPAGYACRSFDVPDDFSIGLSAMPVKNLLVAFDIQRIMYSQLNDSFLSIRGYVDNDLGADYVAIGTTEDRWIPRVGAEYMFLFSNATLALRAGYYREPENNTVLQLYPGVRGGTVGSSPANVTNPPFTSAFNEGFNAGSAENHISFGLGATFGRNIAFDIAGDFSKTSSSGVASLFFRF